GAKMNSPSGPPCDSRCPFTSVQAAPSAARMIHARMRETRSNRHATRAGHGTSQRCSPKVTRARVPQRHVCHDCVVTTGRLVPTPSGHLHLGNALAFGAAWLSTRAAGGRVLLRIEDIDRGRARSDVAAAQRDDLRWLGIDWDEEVAPQSQRSYSVFGAPVYFCDCNRSARFTGGCRCRDAGKTAGAVRFRTPPGLVGFVDRALGTQSLAPCDDPVLLGADGNPMYALAVVTDDARDGVTEVVRG